jgi:site-specific DNA-methyltransferase (adenine-specific)
MIGGGERWKIWNGDCRDVLKLPVFANKRFEVTITDPPYEAQAHTKLPGVVSLRLGQENKRVKALNFAPMNRTTRKVIGREIARLTLKWSLVFCQVEATELWRKQLEKGGAKYRRTGVWVKPDATPQLNGMMPAQGYESIVICHRAGRFKWNGGGTKAVWEFAKANPEGKFHETQKPLALMRRLIELFSDPGDTIFDPFCGSGSTGVAALQMGRQFVGIERDVNYFNIAVERLRAAARGQSVCDLRAGQQTLFMEAR